MSKLSRSHSGKRWKSRHWSCALALLVTGLVWGQAGPAAATSLDGAGRIVVVPHVLAGLERESTIYLTNPGTRTIKVYGRYIGADGTPFSASVVGATTCGTTSLAPGESRQVLLSPLCGLSTPDVENFGYLELSTYGGLDGNPFFANSIVTTRNGDEFGVEGVPVGAFDPGATSQLRTGTLRVIGLEATPAPQTAVDSVAHCYLGALAEDKDVTVQLMEYGTGSAKPLGTPTTVRLKPWTMVKLANVMAAAGLPPHAFSNVTAELYAAGGAVGADLVAGCSVETVQTKTEDFRLATTPVPHDRSRARYPVRGDTLFVVGPAKLAVAMVAGTKARMALYLRHEDRVRCRLVPSLVYPQENPTPWQELRVLDPDGRVVAGGPGINDTGTFFTGLKNAIGQGINGKWVVEVSWQGTPATGYPRTGVNDGAFGVLCESASGVSAMLPLALSVDDF